MSERKNKFGATASHSPNDGSDYLFVEKRMEQIGFIAREAQSLAQGITEVFNNFGPIKLGDCRVFDMLVGEEGKSPFVEFTTHEGMNGWLLLPVEYGEKVFVEQEASIINSIFEQLLQEKVIILQGETSISNTILKTLGDRAKTKTLEDWSTGFYLDPTH